MQKQVTLSSGKTLTLHHPGPVADAYRPPAFWNIFAETMFLDAPQKHETLFCFIMAMQGQTFDGLSMIPLREAKSCHVYPAGSAHSEVDPIV